MFFVKVGMVIMPTVTFIVVVVMMFIPAGAGIIVVMFMMVFMSARTSLIVVMFMMVVMSARTSFVVMVVVVAVATTTDAVGMLPVLFGNIMNMVVIVLTN